MQPLPPHRVEFELEQAAGFSIEAADESRCQHRLHAGDPEVSTGLEPVCDGFSTSQFIPQLRVAASQAHAIQLLNRRCFLITEHHLRKCFFESCDRC